MKRYLFAVLVAGVSLQANAIGRLADVSILDRDTGAVLPTHYYRGEYWVEGTPGARYAIAIRNHLDERLLAVTAVDGVNVISGDGASWSQTGYVFGPYVGYQVDGWRKSDAEVAAFEFAAASSSYSALTGRPANVGVIGVALFRERQAPPIIAQSDRAQSNEGTGTQRRRHRFQSCRSQRGRAPGETRHRARCARGIARGADRFSASARAA